MARGLRHPATLSPSASFLRTPTLAPPSLTLPPFLLSLPRATCWQDGLARFATERYSHDKADLKCEGIERVEEVEGLQE